MNILKNIPTSPGVYIYKNSENKVIYVGKAINLKNRVSQYFQRNDALGPKTKELVSSIHKIEYKIVGSEIEALVLESKLIKKYNPKYNSQLKDNKSYLYLTLHKNFIETTRRSGDFGPFPDGSQVKYLLKILRRIFPFYLKAKHPKTCLYCHIGLCPKNEKENQKNIKMIKKILQGKLKKITNEFEKKLKQTSKNQEYEKAISYRDTLYALNYIATGWQNLSHLFTDIQLSSDIFLQGISELQLLLNIPQINRIECYDISQLGHKYFVGAMSVFQNGIIEKKEYRKFRIIYKSQNDPLMLKEILTRRLKHKEWFYPDLIVFDGGKNQISGLNLNIPLVGLVKGEEKIVTKQNKEILLPKNSKALQLLQQLRDEAHRFANVYRKKLISKSVK